MTMPLPSRINLETTLKDLHKVAMISITDTEIKDLSDSTLLDRINGLMGKFNLIPFDEDEKNALLYKK